MCSTSPLFRDLASAPRPHWCLTCTQHASSRLTQALRAYSPLRLLLRGVLKVVVLCMPASRFQGRQLTSGKAMHSAEPDL